MKMVLNEKQIWREILLAYKDLPCLWKPTDDNYYTRDFRQKAVDSLLKIYRKLQSNATCLIFQKRLENMRTSYIREKKKEILLMESDISKKRKTAEKGQNRDESPVTTNEKSYQKEERPWEMQGKAIGHSLSELKEEQKTIAKKLISDVIFHRKLEKLRDTSFVSISFQADDELYYSKKYVNLGSLEYGATSPTPSNHSSSSHFANSETKNKSKSFKSKYSS